MSGPGPSPLSIKDASSTLSKHWRLWVVPTVAMTFLAAGYALMRPTAWQASQAILVRDEAVGALSRQGRFDSSDAMKTAQETIAEIAKNQAVVAAALASVESPAERTTTEAWPTPEEVAGVRSSITVAAPKGAEFGRTEVIYLSATADSRRRAEGLATAVCNQLEVRLQELRNSKAESIMAELQKTVALAQADLDRATNQLAAIETEVGSDLGELRILNDSGSGDSNLRSSLNQIKTDLRQVRTASEADLEQLKLLETARHDPDRLIATPNRLLETQPALRRLKDGLVDAQLRTAQLLGKMSDLHPEVLAAKSNEGIVQQQLHAELEQAVGGLRADLAVRQSQIASLERQAADVENRLSHLASLRARYGNLVAEARQCSESLQKSQKDLADARGSQAAATSASLITRLDTPVTGSSPIGPGNNTIVLFGAAGGLATGLGLVFLFTSTGTLRGRRLSDYLRTGRRAADQRPGRRTSDAPPNVPATPAVSIAAGLAGDRRAPNIDRRAGDPDTTVPYIVPRRASS